MVNLVIMMKFMPPFVNLGKSYFTTYEEGLCAQILHTGPYNDEPPTIKKLHKFIFLGTILLTIMVY